MADTEPSSKENGGTESALPSIAAIFLVVFDSRKGYTLAWHQSQPNVQLEGSVEFKSLPSGLHNVKEDLVYFIHENYAGISAFQNKPDVEASRNARMLAVGALVPLEHGRMAKIWQHAEGIIELAEKQLENGDDTGDLEKYWQQHQLQEDHQAVSPPVDSPSDLNFDQNKGINDQSYQKSRQMSTGSAFQASNHHLLPHHPALALSDVLKLFGPLIFPLYRAALLRQRILIISETPVEFSCSLVYCLSVISSIPKPLLELLPIDGTPDRRLQPLFNVGVQDIPLLQKPQTSQSVVYSDYGWIACTTDDVLSTKPDLFDVLVLLPSSNTTTGTKKTYPKIIMSSPEMVKSFPRSGIRSTQRDAARYGHLRQSLHKLTGSNLPNHDINISSNDAVNDAASISSKASSVLSHKSIVEPPSWSQVAYTSLVWWASSGDRRTGFNEVEETERERDLSMLYNEGEDDDNETKEIAVVRYFHELTNSIFSILSVSIARADGEDDTNDRYHDEQEDDNDNNDNERSIGNSEGENLPSNGHLHTESDQDQALLSDHGSDEPIEITQDDISAMGLDIWSALDRQFIEQLVSIWWGRQATVRGATIECCGVRIL